MRAVTLGQSGPGSDGDEGLLRILQSFSISGTSQSDWIVPYLGHTLSGGSYPFVGVQSVYSTAPTDWAIHMKENIAHVFSQASLTVIIMSCSSKLNGL